MIIQLNSLDIETSWDIWENAQTIKVDQIPTADSDSEDGTLIFTDNDGDTYAIEITAPADGTYYFIVEYTNPLGSAQSEVVTVIVDTDGDGNPEDSGEEGGGGIGISLIDTFLYVGLFGGLTIVLSARRMKKKIRILDG